MTAGATLDALGLAAGTLTTLAFVPQIARILRMRHADDLSWWAFGALAVGSGLWLAYGVALGSMPIVAANAVTIALLAGILALKWRYRSGGTRGAHGAPAAPR